MENNDFNGSANAGSPIANDVPNPNNLGGAIGQTSNNNNAPQIDPAQHKELEGLVGRQGAELGEFRKFFGDIQPLLDTLDKSPELVQAIMDGKITGDLAKAALEGKVSISDAQIVSQAHEEVKKELGKDGYKGTSSDEVSKLVEAKAKELKMEFDGKLKERDELSAFEANVAHFIANTPDFNKYSSEINKWLDDHDVTDIQVAYYAVKGKISEDEAKKQAEIDKVEAEKSGALNMGGGQGSATRIRSDANVIDNLIAGKSNPNIFG